jgi:hypothetical protein
VRTLILPLIAALASGDGRGQEAGSATSLFGPARQAAAATPSPWGPKIAEAARRDAAALRGELAAAGEREATLQARVAELERRLAAVPPPAPPLKAYCVDRGTSHDVTPRADGGIDVTIDGVTYSYRIQVALPRPQAAYVEPLVSPGPAPYQPLVPVLTGGR